MKWLSSRVAWGILLIVGGVLFLIQNLTQFEIGDLFWALLFGFAGLAFVSVFLTERANWWALIPGFVLLALGAMMALNVLAPDLADTIGGGLFLGAIGLAFLAIYLVNRSQWWAIIPSGVLLTLAIVASLESEIDDTGAVFFLGLALTFAVVGLLPTPEGSQRWAFIPAGILGVLGVLLLFAAGHLVNYVWSIALILVGLILLIRTFVTSRGS